MHREMTTRLLVVASLGCFTMTLNWFAVSAGFLDLVVRLHIGVNGLAWVVSSFILGYGIVHIPAGIWAQRFGLRRVVVAGLLAESMAAGLSGYAPNLVSILGLRLVAGAGAAMVMGSELALVTANFRGRRLALAQGIACSGAYALGALTGLYGWVSVIGWLGMRGALALAGVIGIVTAGLHLGFLPAKYGRAYDRTPTWRAFQRVIGHPNLWWVGLGAMGGYGAYFTLSQLGPTYLVTAFHLTPAAAAGYGGGVMLAAGIPGALLGGYGSDRWKHRKWFILGPGFALGVGFILLPKAGMVLMTPFFIVAGLLVMLARPAYTAIPGDELKLSVSEDIATAEGLLFSLLAIGGAGMPLLFAMAARYGGDDVGWSVVGLAIFFATALGIPMRDVLAKYRHAEPIVGSSANTQETDGDRGNDPELPLIQDGEFSGP